MVFYKQQKGSPWIENFGEAERWVNNEENKRLNLDNIERPNTKWVFVKFSNIEVKAVLDNQAMLGTGPLPDWLRNLAHGCKMVLLDTFRDNLSSGTAWLFIKGRVLIVALRQQSSWQKGSLS